MAWQSAAPTIANPPRSALAAATLAKATLETDIDRLRTQAAPRPSPPKWHPLRREAAAFRDRLGGIERVLGLARGPEDLSEGFHLLERRAYALRSLRAREAPPRISRARVRRLARGVEAARAWEERLELNFGYRDLTEPLRLSVCEMRRGVALLLASAPDPADDADVARELERARGGVVAAPPLSVRRTSPPPSAARAAGGARARLLSFPPRVDLPRRSAAEALASPGAQKALSALERVAARGTR